MIVTGTSTGRFLSGLSQRQLPETGRLLRDALEPQGHPSLVDLDFSELERRIAAEVSDTEEGLK